MLALAAGRSFAALPDITASACNGCSEVQFESKAIGRGTGQHYLYDFGGRTLRYYQVVREPKPGGGYLYEAIELGADPAYLSYFDDALEYRDMYGGFHKNMVINLQQAPNTGGHANESVFNLFLTDVGSTNFGIWLGQYVSTQSPDAAARLDGLIRAIPGITFTGPDDSKQLVVVVEFTDGEATFDLTASEKRYKRRLGESIDSDGHSIPDSPDSISPLRYSFTGGPTSASYISFQSLMNYYLGPIGSGGWRCGTAVGGGDSSTTCVLIRQETTWPLPPPWQRG